MQASFILGGVYTKEVFTGAELFILGEFILYGVYTGGRRLYKRGILG